MIITANVEKGTLARTVKITLMNALVRHVFMVNVLMELVISNALVKLVGLVNIVTKTLTNAIPIPVTMVALVSTSLVHMNVSIVLLVLPSQTAKIKSTNAKSIMLNA